MIWSRSMLKPEDRYNGPDADLKVHAQRHLDFLQKVKARHGQISSDGALRIQIRNESGKAVYRSCLRTETSPCLRLDSAMGLFQTLGFVFGRKLDLLIHSGNQYSRMLHL